jgi:hypothetical protein
MLDYIRDELRPKLLELSGEFPCLFVDCEPGVLVEATDKLRDEFPIPDPPRFWWATTTTERRKLASFCFADAKATMRLSTIVRACGRCIDANQNAAEVWFRRVLNIAQSAPKFPFSGETRFLNQSAISFEQLKLLTDQFDPREVAEKVAELEKPGWYWYVPDFRGASVAAIDEMLRVGESNTANGNDETDLPRDDDFLTPKQIGKIVGRLKESVTATLWKWRENPEDKDARSKEWKNTPGTDKLKRKRNNIPAYRWGAVKHLFEKSPVDQGDNVDDTVASDIE